MATSQLAAQRNLLPDFRLRGVPVLLYHGIGESSDSLPRGREGKYWITRKQFCQQLEWIQSHGYHAILLADLSRVPREPINLSRLVVITFDDGLISDAEVAFPILREFGYRAEFFVNTSSVGQAGYVSWEQIIEMSRAGMSFQSHGVNHVAFTRLRGKKLENELRESRHELRVRLQSSAEFLSAPFGFINSRVVEAALIAGYKGICSSRSWPVQTVHARIDRTAVYRHTTIPQFARLLSGNPLSYAFRNTRAALLRLPKAILPSERNRVTARLATVGSSK
jgi:peptidoglycan/xylan/chitin deacetylase (PgdA/CDA1 family)